ncbi:MAG: YdhR family protein [Burkholderiales bacterium]|nr:YdhR family protein [Burkholderiales bacterium]
MSKVIAMVSFKLPQKQTLDQATATFQGTASKYLGMPGLLRKNYFLSEDGMRAGGLYLWESRQAAERVYTSEWKAYVKGKYGSEPEIVYVDTPVLVDNEQGRISSL